jgi:hypothetical protein
VQVTAQPFALLLPGQHLPFLGRADDAYQRGGVHDPAELVSDIGEQCAIGRAQPPAAPPEDADGSAVGGQRQLLGSRAGDPVAGERPAEGIGDLHGLEAQAGAEFIGECLQQGGHVGRVRQPPARGGEHVGGL